MRMELFQWPRVIKTSSLYSKLSSWVQKGICDDLKTWSLHSNLRFPSKNTLTLL